MFVSLFMYMYLLNMLRLIITNRKILHKYRRFLGNFVYKPINPTNKIRMVIKATFLSDNVNQTKVFIFSFHIGLMWKLCEERKQNQFFKANNNSTTNCNWELPCLSYLKCCSRIYNLSGLLTKKKKERVNIRLCKISVIFLLNALSATFNFAQGSCSLLWRASVK